MNREGYRKPRGLLQWDGIPTCYAWPERDVPVDKDLAIREAVTSYCGWELTDFEVGEFRKIVTHEVFNRAVAKNDDDYDGLERGSWSDCGSGMAWDFWAWDPNRFMDLVSELAQADWPADWMLEPTSSRG